MALDSGFFMQLCQKLIKAPDITDAAVGLRQAKFYFKFSKAS